MVGLPLTGLFGGLACAGVISPERVLTGGSPGALRVMSGLCTALFGGIFLLLLVNARAMTRSQGLIVDRNGISLFQGDAVTPIGWEGIVGIGIGYKVSPAPRAAGNLIRTREGFALEIYSTGRPPSDLSPRFRSVAEAPPYPHLPPIRYRMMLPPFDDVPGRVAQAVQTFAPHLWIGEYQREWHRLPGA